jgi:lipopolysaccharide transport system ATP-binding protein
VLAVGDLGFVIKCLNRMGELIPNAATIFVSHSMPMVSRVSSHALLMDKGKEKYYGADTAEAIKQYVNLFDSPERINQGTGEIELTKIEVYDPKTNKYVRDNSAILRTYDDLKIRFELVIHESITEFSLFTTIFDGQLREVISTESFVNNEPYKNIGEQTRSFELIIPKIILASGKFAVTIGAREPKSFIAYARVTNCIYFTVMAILNSWATSTVPGEWRELNN